MRRILRMGACLTPENARATQFSRCRSRPRSSPSPSRERPNGVFSVIGIAEDPLDGERGGESEASVAQSRAEYVNEMEKRAAEAFADHKCFVRGPMTDELACWKVRSMKEAPFYWANVFIAGGYIGVGGDIELVVWPQPRDGLDPVEWIAGADIDYLVKKVVAGPKTCFDRDVALHLVRHGDVEIEEENRADVHEMLQAGEHEHFVWMKAGAQFGEVPHPAIFYAREAIRVVYRHRGAIIAPKPATNPPTQSRN